MMSLTIPVNSIYALISIKFKFTRIFKSETLCLDIHIFYECWLIEETLSLIGFDSLTKLDSCVICDIKLIIIIINLIYLLT